MSYLEFSQPGSQGVSVISGIEPSLIILIPNYYPVTNLRTILAKESKPLFGLIVFPRLPEAVLPAKTKSCRRELRLNNNMETFAIHSNQALKARYILTTLPNENPNLFKFLSQPLFLITAMGILLRISEQRRC